MYPTLLTLGLLAAIVWLTLVDVQAADNPEAVERDVTDRIEAAASVLFSAILTSRLSFVLLHLDRYQQAPLDILAFWQGGLTAWGAALGLLLGLLIASRRTQATYWQLLDRFAGPASLVALSAWLGCLIDGCAYGRSAAGSLLAVAGPDLTGAVRPRWPTQTIGALGSIGLFALATVGFQSRRKPGSIGLSVWLAHSLIFLGLSWLRADPIRYYGELRSDTLGAAAMLFVGFLLAMYWWKLGDRRQS